MSRDVAVSSSSSAFPSASHSNRSSDVRITESSSSSTARRPAPRAQSTPIDRPASTAVSYHDEENHVLGCSHYSRKCQIRAPCCPPDTFFPCRFCHDEQCDHTIDRHAISDMLCMLCCMYPQQSMRRPERDLARSQPVSDNCVDCGESMARYWCGVCKFFDDEPGRDIFHCDACGICRRGNRDDFFHCERCNCCYSATLRVGHKCIENVLSSVW